MENNRPGRTFFSLPQEIRDEIYRCLVKGRYHFDRHSIHKYTMMTQNRVSRPSTKNPWPAIFQVSKATHDEATFIFYSESVFLYRMSWMYDLTTSPPAPESERMMKIEHDFFISSRHEYRSSGLEIEHTLKATLDKFTGLSRLRNTMAITFKTASPDIHEMLANHFFGRLKALVGFRTVIINIWQMLEPITEEDRQGYDRIAQAMKEEMAMTMGSASMSHIGLNTYLEFHPLEHMRANLGAQAGKLQMEMDKLNSGANGLEEGS